jgi:hypothetical protein
MQATADLLGGQEVSMMRGAQVALIPVFQFGVFCEGDCSFFSGPSFDMIGPVHTNADLYPFVGPGSTLVFHSKVEAYGNIVRTRLSNGFTGLSGTYDGDVWVSTASTNGCTSLSAPGNCTKMATPSTSSPYGDGSVQSTGGNPPAAYIPGSGTDTWTPFSTGTTNHQMINGNYYTPTSPTLPGTGAKKLSMPFVGGNVLPYEILRRPAPGEDTTSALATSREYNMAQIRVLLSDDPTEFTNGTGYSDPDNVRLANLTQAQSQAQGGASVDSNYPFGVPIPAGSYNAGFGTPTAGGNTFNLYFAAASNAVPIPSGCAGFACTTKDWPNAPSVWSTNIYNTQPTLQGLQPLSPAAGTNLAPTYRNNGNPTINLCPPAGITAVNGSPVPTANCLNANATPASIGYPYYAPPNAVGSANYNSSNSNSWSLIDGYLRVEYKDANGAWNPVTREWLGLGFARGSNAPTANGAGLPAGGTMNPITPNAILLLQEPADRSSGAPNTTGTPPSCAWNAGHTICTWTPGAPPQLTADLTSVAKTGTYVEWPFGDTPPAPTETTPQSLTQYNWYPINFYDAREGEARDNQVADSSCTTNGVMNAVEIDVGNLKRWLAGQIGISPVTGTSSGQNVDYLAQNGYVLYFSDRRGMLLNPNTTGPHPAGSKSGDAGLEDVINSASAAGTPNGVSEPAPANAPLSPTNVPLSPEDDNENGVLDTFGARDLGLGFWGTVGNNAMNVNTQINSTGNPDPFGTAANARIKSCSATGRKNWVSGARHVLRLVDGSLGNLPLRPLPIVVHNSDGTTTNYYGGFTVASENPVYILGDYNTKQANWGTDTSGLDASASVIADAVTLLSNSWNDFESFGIAPGNDGTVTNSGTNRNATDTWYRVAIAGGKNMSFTHPGWGAYQDFGTDGGVHNFLRYLEDWGGRNMFYKGSIVSLYYSTYGTGTYKCGNGTVYNPPTRNYSFDSDFTKPEGLPPGTPMFRDVESLNYRQLFTARTD